MKLHTDNLAYGYPKRVIGREVNLSLSAGEVLCVLGPNGSGKTTLFRTLLGLLPARGGDIKLDGRPLSTWSRVEIAQVLGYVPQAHAPYFPFSVCEIVLMGRTAHMGLISTPSREDRQAAEDALALLGILHLADQIYTQISGGERQLTLIARALAQGPKLLVMDEPTASLDFGNQAKVLKHLDGLAESGIGIIFSSHDPDQALRHADSVLMLLEGNVIYSGRPDDVITSSNLRRVYGVDVEVVLLPGRYGTRTCIPAPN
ncbi:MAG: ABC transporter ATP-binding protein [Burkholderiales bacterium]